MQFFINNLNIVYYMFLLLNDQYEDSTKLILHIIWMH
jgi:hypothetical protein